MSYQFSFERKPLLILLAGQLFLGILTFIGGMVTGIALWVPARSEIALLKGKSAQPPTLAGIAAPALPALPALLKPEQAAREAPAPAAPAANPPSAGGEPERPAAAPPAAALPAAAPPAAAEPPAVRVAASPESAGSFCLQLGSFEKAENARKLQSDLKDKGITAIIFDQTDSTQRTWHAVRVGGYNTLGAAAQAAADFSSKWRIQALVRRSDSL